MNDIDLTLLNSSQLTALKQINGAVMVLAGAGSGKTRLVTYRIAYLIKEMGVDPQNILAITFTNKAANEMKERLCKMTSEAENIWISTFHSMCVKILRRHISNLKSAKNPAHQINFDSNFSIYTDTEKKKAIETVCDSLKICKDKEFVAKYANKISDAKNNNLSPWDYQKLNQAERGIDVFTKVYSAYQSFLANNNALDFDDLLTKTYELFIEFPDVLAQYQRKFEYIHIDEFQDTNCIQYQIAKLLAGEHKNIFVVGDEDQCIYSWRGANIQNIFDFKKDFPDFKQFKLEQNYRSTKNILTVANKVIKNNQVRNDKELWTSNSAGVRVEYFQSYNEYGEAEYIVNQIENLVKSDLGYKYSDFAILKRTSNYSKPIEDCFLKFNIPYRVFGGVKFYDRVEIKIITSYLKMLTNPYDSTSFTRIINFPKRGIGEATINSILELSEFHNTTPFNLILNSDEYLLDDKIEKKVKPFKDIVVDLYNNYEKQKGIDFIKYLVEKIGFKDIYNEEEEEDLERLQNIEQFVVEAQKYFEKYPKNTVSDYLQSITLVSDIDGYDDMNNTVTLATVHAVKGLEFKVVFIANLEEGTFPSARAGDDIEEERRLMFVAITRAKQRLYLTNAKTRFVFDGKKSETKTRMPSRFLKECEVIEEKSTMSRFETNALNNNFPSFASMGGRVSFSLNKSTQPQKQNADNLEKKYAVGLKVSHPKFGNGVITSNQGINITKCVSINFEGVGIKTLSVEYAPITLIGE